MTLVGSCRARSRRKVVPALAGPLGTTRRPGAVDFKAGPSTYDIARALDTAGVEYALTGDAGANLYRSSAGEAWPVLYVEDVSRAAVAVGLVRGRNQASSACASR